MKYGFIIPGGDIQTVAELAAEGEASGWDGMFYWSPPLKHGTLYIFRPNNDQTSQVIRLKGLQPQKTYRVHSEDGGAAESTRSGADLMKLGIKVALPSKYSSDLVYIEEK